MPGTHDIIGHPSPLQSGIIPRGTRIEVFQSIYWVFLVLGTLVGIVVISYMLYNAYKYRAEAEKAPQADRPTLGELPRGSGGGRKLFLSFGLSAIIVISLIAWTYGTLLFVEGADTGQAQIEGPAGDQEPIEVQVVGFRFGWRFIFTDVPGHPNGVEVETFADSGAVHFPKDRLIQLNVTSSDVWHSFGIPELRVKADAIPGQRATSWFVAPEERNYTARCYELCGEGHSSMQGKVVIEDQGSFDEWYAQQAAEQNVTASGGNSTAGSAGGNSTAGSAAGNSTDGSSGGANDGSLMEAPA